MTPSVKVKQWGLKSLAQLSRLSHIPVSTLKDWHYNWPDRFEWLCKSAKAWLDNNEEE